MPWRYFLVSPFSPFDWVFETVEGTFVDADDASLAASLAEVAHQREAGASQDFVDDEPLFVLVAFCFFFCQPWGIRS